MENHEFDKIKSAFLKIMDAPEDEREHLLKTVCETPSIEKEVRDLMAYDEPTWASLKGDFVAYPGTELSQIGPYKVLRLIGKGGMGQVFEVEKKESEFGQKYALKIIHPSFCSDGLQQRFEMERLILASLNHPNIARFVDGGISRYGPYFCMEYVDGKSITEFSDDNRLTIEQRIELFSQVFEAVQFSHERFIVHRDLKPSNILVTEQGNVKLLDFGIAKLMQGHRSQKLGLMTQLTRSNHQAPMSPLFASPEQYNQEPISAASDVYSLGLVLYRLLSGHLAYDFNMKTLQEIDQLIVQKAPVAPSSRCLSKTNEDISSSEIAASRNTTPEKLKSKLKGDIDTIILKSLQKDPKRRYGSVASFQQDLQHYLSKEPISARPSSKLYLTKMFVLRHRLSVAFSCLLFLAVLSGSAGTLIGLKNAVDSKNVAQSERDNAEKEANKSREILTFVQNMLASADPDILGRDIKVVDALDTSSKILNNQFNETPEIKAAIYFTLGKTYDQLGMYDKALSHFERGYGFLKYEPDSPEQTLFEFEAGIANIHFEMGHLEKAQQEFEDLIPRLSHYLGKSHQLTLRSRMILIRVYKARGEFKRSEELIKALIETQTDVLGEHHDDTIDSKSVLGDILQSTSRYDQAHEIFSQVLDSTRKRYPEGHSLVLAAQDSVGTIIYRKGDYEEAQKQFQQIFTARKKLLGRTHSDVFKSVVNLTSCYNELGKSELVKELNMEYYPIVREKLGEDHFITFEIMNGLANGHQGLEEYAQARDIHLKALRLKERKFGIEHEQTILTLINLGGVYVNLENIKQARKFHEQAYEAGKNGLGEDHFYTIFSYLRLAEDIYMDNEKEKAMQMMEEALEKVKKVFGENHPFVPNIVKDLSKMRDGSY